MKKFTFSFLLIFIPALIYSQTISSNNTEQDENIKEKNQKIDLNYSEDSESWIDNNDSQTSEIDRIAKCLSSETSESDGYNLGVGRIFYSLNNYQFSGSGEVEESLSRTTIYWTGSGIDEMSLELMISSGSYSTNEIDYEDSIYGFSLSYPFGMDMDGIRLFLRGVAGAVYYEGRTEIEIMDMTDITNFSDWSFYYNFTIGADIFLNDGFGITGKVGISKIPLVSLGIIL